MTRNALLVIGFMLPFVAGSSSVLAQENRKDPCALSFSGAQAPGPFTNSPNTKAQATIFGDPVQVPEFHMRFVDPDGSFPNTPAVVDVYYYWSWLEWPYSERAWGGWSWGVDLVKCAIDNASEVVVPAHTVKPRGWYNGKYTKFPYTLFGSKKPHFDKIEIVFKDEEDRCGPRLVIDKGDLPRYENATAIVRLSCSGSPRVTFEARNR